MINNLRIVKIKANSKSYQQTLKPGNMELEIQDHRDREYKKLRFPIPYGDIETVEVTNDVKQFLFSTNCV